MDRILHAFATAGQGFPREAMQAALAQWEAVSPALLTALADYAEGRARSEEAASSACIILYLAAERRDRRAFPLLCRLARDEPALGAAIGDGITEDLPGLLAACFDGDLDALRGVILDAAADEMLRNAAFEALALLFAGRALPLREAEPLLRDLHDRLAWQKQVPAWAWVGWLQAVAVLGVTALRPEALSLLRAGRVGRDIMDASHFEEDLRAGAMPGVDRLELLADQGVEPIGDVMAMFSEWGRIRQEEAARAASRATRAAASMVATTRVDPFRHVGRNDPCPCGSGKKFKKCCIPA